MPENPAYPGQEAEARETKTFFTESLNLAVDSKQHMHTYSYETKFNPLDYQDFSAGSQVNMFTSDCQ